MKMIIESTDVVTQVSGVPARIWRGTTEDGRRCVLLVPVIAVDPDHADEFDSVLREIPPPKEFLQLFDALQAAQFAGDTL